MCIVEEVVVRIVEEADVSIVRVLLLVVCVCLFVGLICWWCLLLLLVVVCLHVC